MISLFIHFVSHYRYSTVYSLNNLGGIFAGVYSGSYVVSGFYWKRPTGSAVNDLRVFKQFETNNTLPISVSKKRNIRKTDLWSSFRGEFYMDCENDIPGKTFFFELSIPMIIFEFPLLIFCCINRILRKN